MREPSGFLECLYDILGIASTKDLEELEQQMQTQQQQVDALVAELAGIKTSLASTQDDIKQLSTGITGLESSITDLNKTIADLKAAQAAGTPLDLSVLEAGAVDLQNQVGELKTSADALVAELPPPAPPAAQPNPPAAPATPAAPAAPVPQGGVSTGFGT